MGLFYDGDFQKEMRVSIFIFWYLCILLGYVLKKKDSHFKENINVEGRIAIIFSWFASGNLL